MWAISIAVFVFVITVASACPNSQTITCFQGSQSASCAGAQLGNASGPCLPSNYDFSNINWQVPVPVYCVLIKYTCTSVSHCTKSYWSEEYGNNNFQKWSDAVLTCAIIPPILSDSGCSSQEVARNASKWVSRLLIAPTVHGFGFNTTTSCLDNPVWNTVTWGHPASMCFCSSDYCNSPLGISSKAGLSTSADAECAYALQDYPPSTLTSASPATTASPAQAVIINNYITVVVIIFQFKAPYQLSEITPDVETKMAKAVADVLGVNATSISLTFVEVDMRRAACFSRRVFLSALA